MEESILQCFSPLYILCIFLIFFFLEIVWAKSVDNFLHVCQIWINSLNRWDQKTKSKKKVKVHRTKYRVGEITVTNIYVHWLYCIPDNMICGIALYGYIAISYYTFKKLLHVPNLN